MKPKAQSIAVSTEHCRFEPSGALCNSRSASASVRFSHKAARDSSNAAQGSDASGSGFAVMLSPAPSSNANLW